LFPFLLLLPHPVSHLPSFALKSIKMNAAAATERMRRELKSLVVQIKSKNVAHQLNGLTQLKIFSSADAENKELIREEGTIEPTVQLLGSENVKVQLAAVRLLRSLSVNEENQQRIADEDGIPPLISLLESPFAKLQLNAAATLWNLSVNDNNKRAIAKEGAIRPLIFLLDSNNVKVQNEACGALRNLSFNERNQRLVGKDGGIILLMDLLKSEDENLRRNSAITLNNLTSISDDNRRRLRKEGGVELLINVLLANDINVLGFDVYTELKQSRQGQAGAEAPGTVGAAADGAAGAKPGAVASKGPFAGSAVRLGAVSVSGIGRNQAGMTGSTLEGPPLSLTSDVFDHLTWGEVKIERKIGQGAYGDVFKARYFGYPVAVKVIKDPLSADEVKREKILEELKIMVLLKHPNVVMLMGACLTPDNQVAIITEMCERGNLKDTIKDIKSLPIRLKLAKDIACGLNWLHSNHIIHRDLKLANLLVSLDWTVKITDFGLSLHWHPGIVCHHFKGNVKYSAPEILRARSDKNITVYSYGPQTDVYSFGLMLWELVTCMPLFPGVKGKQNITDHVLFGNRPEIYEEWPKSLKTLLQLSWHVDPVRRPLFSEIQEKFDRVIIDVMCLARDTPILMADGSFKMVQDIVEGDQVMGEDGTSVRTVQATTTGRQTMAKVTLQSLRQGQTEPVSFECNLSHLLSLKVAHAARVQQEAGTASVSVVVCRRGAVAQLGDNVVDRLWTMTRETSSLREAATIVMALGGHVHQAQTIFESLGDAIRAVSAHCGLALDEVAVAAIADRTVAQAPAAFAADEQDGAAARDAKVRRCPAAANVHSAALSSSSSSSVARALPVAPIRLALDATQVAQVKRALADSLDLPAGMTVYAHDETVDVATRHVLDPVAVHPSVRRNLLAYRAPVLHFTTASRADEALPVDPYALGYLLAAAATGGRRATSTAAADLSLAPETVTSVVSGGRVPLTYRVASVAARREVLAGLLDGAVRTTDEDEGASRCVRFPVTDGALSDDAAFVARSLGLVAWRAVDGVCISADRGDVPTRSGRKWTASAESGRDPIAVETVGDGDFFGFTLDGNGRFFVGHSLVATHNCPDPTGRRICKKLWRGEELRRVPYDEFEETFLEKTRLNLKLIRHVHLKALCAVICDPYDDTVTLERFCNCVNWFGPMYPVEKFLDRLKDELSNDWFHGYVSSNRAAQLLKTRWSSTKMTYYLCRFSLSAPGCFAFTFVDEDGQIVHKRVSHSYNTNYCLTNSSPALEAPTLDQLHALARQQNDLLRGKRVLPGNPHQSLFL